MEPITRNELFMASAGGQSVELPEPITREEVFLKAISDEVHSAGRLPGTTVEDAGKTLVVGPDGEFGLSDVTVEEAVSDWLDDHPEATTTVQDGAITKAKLDSSLKGTVDDVSLIIDSYIPTWNLWDGSWGLSNKNPATGTSYSYMVFSQVIPVVGGEYYSFGAIANSLYGTKVNVIGISWRKADGTAIGNSVTLNPQGGYLKWLQAPSTAEKAYIYFNSNNASVSVTPDDIYNAGIKIIAAQRLVNFSHRDGNGLYVTSDKDWIPSYVLSDSSTDRVITKTVTVGANNSNYTSIRAALNDISSYGSPSEKNRYVVEIKEGTYDIASYFTAEEKAAENYIGLVVPDWVTLKGVGNREKTILTYVLSEPSSIICTLNLQNTCGLENLTIYGEKTRYTVHDDKANYVGTPYKRYCKNVHFKGDTMTFGAVYGAGINSNAEWTFEDCIFESLTQTSYQNCFSVHGSGQAVQVGSSSVTFNNCRFIGYGTNNSVILSTLINNASYFQNYCKFSGCSANGRLILREENASAYGAGIAWWATGFATTFTDEIISNTDGVDYSDHIDII